MHQSSFPLCCEGRVFIALGLTLLGASCVSLGGASRSPASDGSAATPQRPTLSSDTNTTVEGTFEVELGGTWDPDSFIDTPTTLKFGAGPATEVFIGWSPFLYVENPGRNEYGVGDVAFGMRHRFQTETSYSPATVIQTSVKFPTANEKDGLGSGEVDASFAGIATKTFGEYGVTGFYSLNLLGDPSGGADLGQSLALSSSTPKINDLSFFGEVAGVWIPEQDTEQLFSIVGLTFNPRPSCVFDCGVLIGLNQDAPDLQFVVGLTQNLGSARALRRR